jgi:hypothetical protein
MRTNVAALLFGQINMQRAMVEWLAAKKRFCSMPQL